MKRKVFVDGSNIAHLCFHVAKGDEKTFGNVYRNVSRKIQRMFPSSDCIYSWEGGGSTSNRRELFPEYKQNRVKRDSGDNLYFLMENAKTINDDNGVLNIQIPGMEADDVIYALANEYKETKEGNFIISSDHDFIQVVQEGLVRGVYSYQAKKFIPIPEYDIVMYKSLVGDSSDNIPGVKGCGPKTAIKYLKEGIPPKYAETVDKFWKVISLKNYSETFDTVNQVREALR